MSWWDRFLRWLLPPGESASGARWLGPGARADLLALADALELAPQDAVGDVRITEAVLREVCERLRGIASGV